MREAAGHAHVESRSIIDRASPRSLSSSPPALPQDLPGAIGPNVMISKLGLDSVGNNPLKRRNWYMQVSQCATSTFEVFFCVGCFSICIGLGKMMTGGKPHTG